MSVFNDSVSSHDMFVGIAIRVFLTEYGGELVYVDGRVVAKEHQKLCPNSIHGYRADAVVLRKNGHWFIEVKSIADLHSDRSILQYAIVAELIRSETIAGIFLLVFGEAVEPLSIPAPLVSFRETGQIVVSHVPFTWRDYDETRL